MRPLDVVRGQHVTITGPFGTPSQRSAVWVIDNPITWGLETVQIFRMEDPDCIMRIRCDHLEPMSPLKLLARQAL